MTENTKLEVKKGERSYTLECSPDSPLGELFDVITQMRDFVVLKINEQNQYQDKTIPEE